MDKSEPGINCATMLKYLADDTRLDVVRQLMRGPMHVGELNATLPVDQSLLSHHLKILRDAGIVTAQRDGKAVLYSLAPSVESLRKGKSINLGCCSISFD
ncbi:MAG: metalloregulator ArsR/SmtB family transcription factor [Planctomycetota bacterium]